MPATIELQHTSLAHGDTMAHSDGSVSHADVKPDGHPDEATRVVSHDAVMHIVDGHHYIDLDGNDTIDVGATEQFTLISQIVGTDHEDS